MIVCGASGRICANQGGTAEAQGFCPGFFAGAKAFFVVPRIFAATYIFLIERNEYYGENPLQNLFN